MFIGPFEHHSNELPWRESICDVVTIPEDRDGHIDVGGARAAARRARRPAAADRRRSPPRPTSPASSATRTAIADLLHRHGALSFWDFAAAAPYVDIEMNRQCAEHPRCHKDAVFLSPHKFIGGPGTPGVLVVRRELLTNRVPGRARWRDGRLRQPARAPLRRRPGAPRGGRHARRSSSRSGPGWSSSSRRPSASRPSGPARRRCSPGPSTRGGTNPAHRDPRQPRRRAAVDRVVRRTPAPAGPARPARRTCTTTTWWPLLNDLFGIQSRGGCSCAGPYGHRLLGIDIERSHEFEREIAHGCEGIKPGWVRINFNYFISEAVLDYVIEAVALVAEHGWRLLPDYRFEPATGLWRHRAGPVEPPLRLGQVAYDADGDDDLPPPRRAGARVGAAPATSTRRGRSSPRRGRRSPTVRWRRCPTTSSTCAGSSCRRSACSPEPAALNPQHPPGVFTWRPRRPGGACRGCRARRPSPRASRGPRWTGPDGCHG